MEFTVPASGQNLELSVPTHLVLTFCTEKSLICTRMLHKCTLCCSNRENNGSEFRKLKELKKLARYARLGKLKANSLAHVSERYRLLTSLTLWKQEGFSA